MQRADGNGEGFADWNSGEASRGLDDDAMIAASAVLAVACSTGAKKEWRKPDIEPNSQAMRDQVGERSTR